MRTWSILLFICMSALLVSEYADSNWSILVDSFARSSTDCLWNAWAVSELMLWTFSSSGIFMYMTTARPTTTTIEAKLGIVKPILVLVLRWYFPDGGSEEGLDVI